MLVYFHLEFILENELRTKTIEENNIMAIRYNFTLLAELKTNEFVPFLQSIIRC